MALRTGKLVFLLFFYLCSSALATTWCFDPVNGNDANTGIAAGTLPNFTNCFKSIEKISVMALANNDNIYQTGVFHHNTLFNNNDMVVYPSGISGVTWTSYGSVLARDKFSDASISSWIDGADCLGKVGTGAGECATAQNAAVTWTLVSGSIYSTPDTAYIHDVFVDNVQGWAETQLVWASCLTSPCVDSVTSAANLPIWLPSHVYAGNSDVQNGTYPAEWWHTVSGGTSGSTPPTCTACTAGVTTFTDNTVSWVFEGTSAGTIGAMVAGSKYWDGQKLNVWMKDGTNPNTHIVEASTALYPVHFNVTGGGNNNTSVTHIGMRHTGGGPLFFNNSTTVGVVGLNLSYDYVYQTGPGLVDLSQFLNGIRLTGAGLYTQAANFTHNYIHNIGDHGGCITLQVSGGTLVAFNDVAACQHGGFNATQSGTNDPGDNIIVNDNAFHDMIKTLNAGVATNSNAAIYAQYTKFLITKNNYIWNILDPACGGGGQCAGILLAGTTGTQVINNTISGVQVALSESTAANTGIQFFNNITDTITPELGVGVPISITALSEIGGSDNNILPGTNVAQINGINTTMAAWQADGFDLAGFNGSATFLNPAFPYFLAPGSLGIGTGDASWGNGQHIGANQLLLPGLWVWTWPHS